MYEVIILDVFSTENYLGHFLDVFKNFYTLRRKLRHDGRVHSALFQWKEKDETREGTAHLCLLIVLVYANYSAW